MVALLWIAGAAALVGVARLFMWKVWFYRDPRREPPEGERLIIAPADGRVVYIRPFRDGVVVSEKLGERIAISEIGKGGADYGGSGWILGIYMSPLDVHFNYAPVSGTVTGVIFTPAALNLPMVDMWEYVRLTYLRGVVDLFTHRYRLTNERNTILLDGEGACPRIVLVEIADRFVNKIRCFVKPGDRVSAGQKVSFIERGSQVDIVVYDERIRFKVNPGQHVTGGITAIAVY